MGQAEVRIGNPGVAVSEVFYVGLAPGTAGGYVVVLRVPADLDTGDHPVVLRVGEGITPVGFVPVRKE